MKKHSTSTSGEVPRPDPFRDGDVIHLSLFDPMLPEMTLDGAMAAGSRACRCKVAVERVEADGYVVRLPPCESAKGCFSAGRQMHGTCETPKGRVAFSTEISDRGDEGKLGGDLAKLLAPDCVKSANARGAFRVLLLPKERHFVEMFGRGRLETWLSGADVVTAGENWDVELLEEGPTQKAAVVDISLTGCCLAFETPAGKRPMEKHDTALMALTLPGWTERLPVWLVCTRVEPWGDRLVKAGFSFRFMNRPKYRQTFEAKLGTWLRDRQRKWLKSRCSG